ncbi:MAG: hypothetical protein HYZ53_17525 [Planctomycetes bacterium]|nr:hypothetical protein [Planctomycetota bacterium]
MATPQDILFGRLAITQGYVTQEEVDECVHAQGFERKPLGETMRTRGYISRLQLETLLKLQQQHLGEVDVLTQRRYEDVLFGKIAYREGLATQEEVNECLRLQAKWEREGRPIHLGQLMCERGYLSAGQVHRILELQRKRLMICPGCQGQCNVGDFEAGKQFACPRCGSLMAVAEDAAMEAENPAAPAAGTASAVPSAPPAPGSTWGGVGPSAASILPQAFDSASTVPPPPPAPFAWAAPPAPGEGAAAVSASPPWAPAPFTSREQDAGAPAPGWAPSVPQAAPPAWAPPPTAAGPPAPEAPVAPAAAPVPPAPPASDAPSGAIEAFEADFPMSADSVSSADAGGLDGSSSQDTTLLAVPPRQEDPAALAAIDDTLPGIVVACPMCGTEFSGRPDADDRMVCPKCQTQFSPRL